MQENDRRFRQRFDMRVQVRIRTLDSPDLTEQQVESSNISARGVYFSTDLPLDIGARVEMFLTMPVEIAGKDSRLWRCTGRVVRMQPRSPSQAKAGNGVEIRYRGGDENRRRASDGNSIQPAADRRKREAAGVPPATDHRRLNDARQNDRCLPNASDLSEFQREGNHVRNDERSVTKLADEYGSNRRHTQRVKIAILTESFQPLPNAAAFDIEVNRVDRISIRT